MNLGLDLRGGASLLAEVQVEDVYVRHGCDLADVRDALRAVRARSATLPRDRGRAMFCRCASRTDGMLPRSGCPGSGPPRCLARRGGATDLEVSADGPILTVQLSDAERLPPMIALCSRRLRSFAAVLMRRARASPRSSANAPPASLCRCPASAQRRAQGTHRQDSAAVLRPVVSIASTRMPIPGQQHLPDVENEDTYYVLERVPVVTGEDLTDSQPDDQNGQPAVSFSSTRRARAPLDTRRKTSGRRLRLCWTAK